MGGNLELWKGKRNLQKPILVYREVTIYSFHIVVGVFLGFT